MRRLRAPFLFVAILVAVVAADSLTRAAVPASTVVVKPSTLVVFSSPTGWYFWDDATDTPGSPASMVAGPGVAPLGNGSVRLGPLTTTSGTSGSAVVATNAYYGTPLAIITSMSYASYQPGPTVAPALQFDIQYRPTDTSYGGRLVFEPYQTVGTVAAGWQTWDPLNGKWWASKTTAAGSNGICGQSSPCTWNAILAAFPNAKIAGRVLFKAGSNWLGFDGNVDALTIGVSGADTTYDFEPEVGCTTDCYVDATSGNDGFGGNAPGSAKKSIQAALAQVSTGGTVHVAGGAYTGPFAVTRAVTLLGAQAGVDPRGTRAGAESVLTGLTTVSGANVTIDGFLLTNPQTAASAQAVLVKTAGAGVHILNNIISGVGSASNTGTAHAIYLENGPDDAVITHNVVTNVMSNASSVSAVLIGDSLATNPSLNILIQGNAFSNLKSGKKGAYGVSVNNGANVAPGPTRGYTVLQVLDNTIDDLAGGIAVGATSGWAHAIALEGDTPGVIVTGNTISNVVDAVPVPVADAAAVFFESNAAFTTAQVTNNAFDGVDTGIGASVALLQAGIPGAVVGSCNWWGNASGPNLMTLSGATIVYLGPGTGAHVVPQVTSTPWKVSPTGPCSGGIPVCQAGTYLASPNDMSCTPASEGHYVPTDGATSQIECPIGYYAPTTGLAACLPAAPGTYVPDPGANQAFACAVGSYQDVMGAASCTPAQPGTFVDTTGAASATACAIGSYQNLSGQASCILAPAGTKSPTEGAVLPLPCTAGTYSDTAGSASCTMAAPGTFVPFPQQTHATACAIGTYQPNSGQTSCIQAAFGHYVPTTGSATETACAAGTYADLHGMSHCNAAPVGTYVATTGAAAATLCAPGTYQDVTGATSCKPSPAGYYVPTAGASSATLCPVGTTSLPGATTCTPAAPPTFSATPANITTTATSASGAVVTYTNPTARDYNNVAVAVTCAPASGSTFPIATTTVTCTATDAYAHSATTSFTVTVTDVTTPGAMSGEGTVKNGDDRYKFNFDVRERASGERGKFSLEVNYAKRTVLDSRGRPKQVDVEDGKFRSTSVTFVAFSDDPTVRPGRSNRPQVDSVLFAGAGQWNGRSGYTYEVRAVDQGEPGRHRESVSITIRDASGAIVAQASGDLVSGNVRSSRIRH